MNLNKNRLILIDSLRGVAAVWVMLYHFYNALLPEDGGKLFWTPVDTFLQLGHLGVYIFFVLSGFVINLSLKSEEMTGSFFFRFLFRRSVRLDIPYWTVILITGISVFVLNSWGGSRREVFTFSDYLLNMVYLDNLLGIQSIVAVGWTLQYEIQFYLFFALILYVSAAFKLSNTIISHALLFTFVVSILYWFPWFPIHQKGLFIDYWFCFLLGVFVNDVINNRIKIWIFWMAICLAIFHGAVFWNLPALMAALTSLFLFSAGRLNSYSSWLNWKPLIFLGSISYSLYLLHPFFGNQIIRFINYRYDISLMWGILIFVIIIVFTVFLVWIFYRLIELPSHRLSKKIKL